jgi:hypothetical protein
MPPRKAPETPPPPASPAKRHRWPAAMPFVIFEKEHFSVNADAATFLEQLGDTPLGVVALAGPYRNGKSFLLNRVLLQHAPGDGFQVGQTVNACTKGLHISTKLLQPERSNYQVLVVDTEGLGAVSATDTHDARIFSLALLLSSMFLYNSKGAIDQPAINNLSLVANISEHIRTSTAQGGGNNHKVGDLSDFFPAFLWVVRDFCLDLVTEQGEPLQPDEYLENALRPMPGVPPEKNKVRESLTRFFKDRGCVTMVRPCDDEATLKSLNTHNNNHLKPEFLDQAAYLRQLVMTRAKPKLMCDMQLTGPLLVRLARIYCDAINQGVAPAIQDSWSLISADECAKAVDVAKNVFLQCLSEARIDEWHRDRKAVPVAILEKTFTQGFEKAAQAYKSKAVGDRAEEYREKLRDMLRITAEKLRAENHAIVVRKAEHVCEEFAERFMALATFEDVRTSFGDVEALFYKDVGKDPISRAALFEQIAKRVWDWATRYHAQLSTNFQVMEVRLVNAEQVVTKLTADADTARHNSHTVTEQLQHAQRALQTAHETQTELETKIAGLENELLGTVEQFEQQEQRQREQQQAWQQQVEQAQIMQAQHSQALTDATIQIQELQNQHADMITELEYAKTEMARLQDARTELLEVQQELDEVQQARTMLQRQIADLTHHLNKAADEHRVELAQLSSASSSTISELQAIKDNAVHAARETERRAKDAHQVLEQTKQKLTAAVADVAKLQNEVQTFGAERSELKAELAEIRTEAAKNVKTFQRQLDEQAAQTREESRKRAAKTREETDKLFQEKLSAVGRAQNAEARVTHLEEALKEAKDAVIRERERAREQNLTGKMAELENKLATAHTRHDLLQASLRDKTDQVTEQQSRITDLEATLRQIEQRHEAEKMRIVLDYTRKMVHA